MASVSSEAAKTRNLGIIAHIDAGKTTTTERMLFYGGFIPRIGEVDQGNTVMDYLPAERERGITIQAAAITFPWRDHRLNLIDTPGHADFTFEVERSLRVLDGAVTILDAVAGVEAQTEKVWKQANVRQIPRMVFVNKMDRVGAGFGRTVSEVASKLNSRPLVLQLPIFEHGLDGGNFIGLLDLLSMQCLIWAEKSDGKDVTIHPVHGYANTELVAESILAREALVEVLSELDEVVVDAYLEHEDANKIPIGTLKHSIRRLCLSGTIVPVLAGAAFRNIGIQPLLDAVLDYLPSPLDRPDPVVVIDGKESALSKAAGACGLAFKVIIDQQRGPMVFVRMYKGSITRGSTLYNTTTKTKERAMKILQMYADEAREVDQVAEGNIAVILGLKDTKTGDTLISARDSNKTLLLQPIPVPPPVFIATLETDTVSEAKALDLALTDLLREDPSLRVSHDDETGQTLLSGMGELHLEIAGNRLLNDFKAKAEIGKLRIGYRESVTSTTTIVDKLFERQLSTPGTGAGTKTSIRLSITLQPLTVHLEPPPTHRPLLDGNLIGIQLPPTPHADFSNLDARRALENGCAAGLSRGLLLGYPVHHAHITLALPRFEQDSSLGSLSHAAQAITQAALDRLGPDQMAVLEPIMAVTLTLPETNLGTVINDLTGTRGGQILSLDEDDDDDDGSNDASSSVSGSEVIGKIPTRVYIPKDNTMASGRQQPSLTNGNLSRVVQARVPLKEMIGYSRALRTLTGGRGSFSMNIGNFEPISQRNLLQLRQSLGL